MSQSVLAEIVARTRAKVHERYRDKPLDRILSAAPTPGHRRDFLKAIEAPGFSVIAEFKRRSPSRGAIREDLHPVQVAQAYEVGGARALSVLTEPDYFGGDLDDLQQARGATLLPVLRKDFIVDPYQVWESWSAGADAALLIVAALSERELIKLHDTAEEIGLPALVEVHDADELRRAVDCGARLIGVNSRDLRTLEVRLETALELAQLIPDDVLAIAESGIKTGADLRRLQDVGYDGFLIGEHLMQAKDPGVALERLLAEANGEPR